MAQFNSTPGKNETAANVVVAPGIVQLGAATARAVATLTTVSYSQNEPGAPKAQRS
jgi:hypothetical protein